MKLRLGLSFQFIAAGWVGEGGEKGQNRLIMLELGDGYMESISLFPSVYV